MFGDYELLSTMYGISGASGKYTIKTNLLYWEINYSQVVTVVSGVQSPPNN